ncbi:MAG: DNA topoisomerase IB [Acidobacteriota bacterium]
MTRVEQLQRTGIIRSGSPRRGFRYKNSDGRKVSADDLNRITELGIPPAWTEVAISPLPGGRLQAVGKDAAGRWQYRYHENHVRGQEQKKFKRIIKFAEALPKMRISVGRHLRQPDLNKERVLACILRILGTCFMRPGSQVYASENGSYGIATLRPKHVKVKGETVEFDFPGKSGVRQQRLLKDRQVAKVVRRLLKYPGAEVFRYQNGDGQWINIHNRHVNEYIKEIMGERFSAKDFRTWAGTIICACALARVGTEAIEKKPARKRKVVAAIKETAEMLGNTPAVCRSSYICPEVINSFEKGRIIEGYFETLEDFIAYRGRKLHPGELAMLKFLKQTATK